jgi:hypothetical protein
MKNGLSPLTATTGNPDYGLAIGFTVTVMAFAAIAFKRITHEDE